MSQLTVFFASQAEAISNQIAQGALAASSFFSSYSQDAGSLSKRAKNVAMLHQLARDCDDEMPNQSAELRYLASCD